ncbi:type II toxin-antitoxin system RatA family toxin [Gimibacter soli]|uniref:Type II toxin-antitoxin system RatA family toxin n=1 Tax=Gimibacter soli TaxID=3024400 RepID=A0AAF0BLA4_9PROT|nr:type II toxin-antitoxin system RatA family toxin [Gimibacter soli]WCL52936.1 type II toxin-antitoxin system RatA family toxin [Gimibacter soli]
MPRFEDIKRLPYTTDELFAVVIDVARYQEFLPWCLASRVFNRKDTQFDADLVIGFKMFREKFTSRVSFKPGERIDIDYIKGPMKRLYNHWRFLPDPDHPDKATLIDFEVDFEFKSKLLEKMIGPVFTEATHRMIKSFEERAVAVYGPRDLP